MRQDRDVDLRQLLPAGEWADICVLSEAPGMMRNKNWAILARARWLRSGGKCAFIKFILPASVDAGTVTEMVTGKPRLRHLHDKLQAIRGVANTVPVVPLLELRHTDDGLLIAMEEVTVLRGIIEQGKGRALCAQLLQDLDPGARGTAAWLHFDICPANVGVLASGRCVLIDVDSWYLLDGDRYSVTVPAWKPFRAPQVLVETVQNRLATKTLDRATALMKANFEIALASAECVLGLFPAERGAKFDRALLNDWVARANPGDPAVAFWKEELEPAVQSGLVRPLADLARDLRSILTGQRVPLVATMAEPMEKSAEDESVSSVPQRQVSAEDSEWNRCWEALKPLAVALRAGNLGRTEIQEYRRSLETLAQQFPGRMDVWKELLLVTITFEKDGAAALELAQAALHQFPEDLDLSRTKSIVQMWVSERSDGNQTR